MGAGGRACTALQRSHRAPALRSGTCPLLSHPTQGHVRALLVPGELLSNSSLDSNTKGTVHTQPHLCRLVDRTPLPWGGLLGSDKSSSQPGWETGLQAGGRRKDPSQDPSQVLTCISKASLRTELFLAV